MKMNLEDAAEKLLIQLSKTGYHATTIKSVARQYGASPKDLIFEFTNIFGSSPKKLFGNGKSSNNYIGAMLASGVWYLELTQDKSLKNPWLGRSIFLNNIKYVGTIHIGGCLRCVHAELHLRAIVYLGKTHSVRVLRKKPGPAAQVYHLDPYGSKQCSECKGLGLKRNSADNSKNCAHCSGTGIFGFDKTAPDILDTEKLLYTPFKTMYSGLSMARARTCWPVCT